MVDEESEGLTSRELYSLYNDERRRAIEWEYRETDKLEIRQYCTCIMVMASSMLIIFLDGDSWWACMIAMLLGAASLHYLHLSSVLSQDGIRFYRDKVIGPTMKVDPGISQEYSNINVGVDRCNRISGGLCTASLFMLVIRCIQEVAIL